MEANPMNTVETIITRLNELGIAMGVQNGELVLEGDLDQISASEDAAIENCRDDLKAYLTAPRERVAIICKHRHPDGRACGEIVTVQGTSGKLAWCQNCYNYPATVSGRTKDETCYCCGSTDWWVSIHGQRICRVCHPPVDPALEADEEVKEEPPPAAQPLSTEDIVPNLPHVVLPLREPAAERVPCAPAMYVADDLEYWTTDEPHLWADKVGFYGKEFVRVTPEVIAWFKEQIAKAEVECNAGRLPVDDFTQIIRAFCPVYEFAIRVGMIPNPVPKTLREEPQL